MQKYSNFVLYAWLLFQITLAAGIVFSMLILHTNAPGISIILSDEEISSLNPKAIDTMNALAILMNGTIVIFLSTLFFVLKDKKALDQKEFLKRIVIPLVMLQILGFVSDSYFNNVDLLLNIVSSMVLLLGLVLSAKALKR
jgi:hypothetical protein